MSFIYKYPHPSVTTDCVILTFHEDRIKILLIKRGIEPYKGYWARPGGFLRMDESAEEGALRELREETGVTGCVIKQFHTFTAPDRDPRERVITIAFYALMKWQQATGADDAELADWVPLDNLPQLAFDHAEIIKMAIQAIKRDIFFEPVGFELLNDTFSMTELQRVYELILGREFDRRNFAKKMKHLDILEEVEKDLDSSPGKTYPLPFLNSDFNRRESSRDEASKNLVSNEEDFVGHPTQFGLMMADFSSEEPADLASIFPETKHSEPDQKSRRRNLLFRLNRKKYDKLKDDHTLEF